MKRTRTWTRRLLRSFILGGVTTVALAWIGGALVGTSNSFTATRARGLSPSEWWVIGSDGQFTRRRVLSVVMIRATQYTERDDLGALPGWAAGLPEPVPLNAWPNSHYEIIEGCGWPWVALTYRFSGSGTGAAMTGKVMGGVPLPARETGAWYDPRALPLVPYWPGFAANLGLWAAGWFMMLAAVGTLRAARRRRRGLCMNCGYEARAVSPCPECGA